MSCNKEINTGIELAGSTDTGFEIETKHNRLGVHYESDYEVYAGLNASVEKSKEIVKQKVKVEMESQELVELKSLQAQLLRLLRKTVLKITEKVYVKQISELIEVAGSLTLGSTKHLSVFFEHKGEHVDASFNMDLFDDMRIELHGQAGSLKDKTEERLERKYIEKSVMRECEILLKGFSLSHEETKTIVKSFYKEKSKEIETLRAKILEVSATVHYATEASVDLDLGVHLHLGKKKNVQMEKSAKYEAARAEAVSTVKVLGEKYQQINNHLSQIQVGSIDC